VVTLYKVFIPLAKSFKEINRREPIKLPVRSAIALLAGKYEIGNAVYGLAARTEIEFMREEVIDISQFAGKRIKRNISVAVETTPLLVTVQRIA
jgi:hypothetical protein